ncbi:MAG: NADH:flavin oxidoreductase [Deltaproteobacteria bacterium]|nr:NADH:flavin oxidoreductase [Deltaproteobacteria bacterium]
MGNLFGKSAINGLELKNRFVRSATWEGMADQDGNPTPKLLETMTALAAGGVGLSITSHAFVSPDGRATPWQLAIDKDERIDGLRKMTDAVHAAGGRIAVQLAHAGAFAAAALSGMPRLVVSPAEGSDPSPQKEMETKDIKAIIEAYAVAAERAKAAGFDGLQIHAAHGYLLSQFLSPAFNKRRDDYGGDIRHRVRIHREICHTIRETVGKDFPILIKMNCRDFIENGLTTEDSVAAAKLLVAAGIDAVELSGGTIISGKFSPSRSRINDPGKEAYFREEARAFKDAIRVPLILVGGNRSFEVADQLVEGGTADYISMSRPFIREPELIRRWQEGDLRKAECISDNLCFTPALEGRGVYCVTRERELQKQQA